jgi:predicted lipoprotein with Yx(FWY)xxD motif
MKRLLAPSMAIAATLVLGACGGGGGGGSASSGSAATTVSLDRFPGIGSVLVDRSGKALYSSDQEASGRILCSGACNAFWKPLTVAAGNPTTAASGVELGVIRRPDGTRQVTAGGKPLYTFSEDSAGKAAGDNFSDDFGGRHFTWHVVRSSGQTDSGAGGAPAGGANGGSGGGYGY